MRRSRLWVVALAVAAVGCQTNPKTGASEFTTLGNVIVISLAVLATAAFAVWFIDFTKGTNSD